MINRRRQYKTGEMICCSEKDAAVLKKGKNVIKKVGKIGILLFFSGIFLAGCRNVDLEYRDFPTAAVVLWNEGKLEVFYAIPDLKGEPGSEAKEESQEAVLTRGETMEEIEKSFQYQSEKYLDMSHLKAVVFGKQLMKEKKIFEEVLKYFEQNPVFARNMIVFACEESDKEKILDLALKNDTSFGFYLENLYKNNPDIGKEKEITLGDLLGKIRKGEEMPLPEIKENSIQLTP